MEFIDHDIELGTALITPGLTDYDRAVLNPNIEIERLEFLYQQTTDILQLFQTSFSKIGSFYTLSS
jgi:hypothetical protein